VTPSNNSFPLTASVHLIGSISLGVSLGSLLEEQIIPLIGNSPILNKRNLDLCIPRPTPSLTYLPIAKGWFKRFFIFILVATIEERSGEDGPQKDLHYFSQPSFL
jgi:hypothetical protein